MPAPVAGPATCVIVARVLLCGLAGALAWASWSTAAEQVRGAQSASPGALWSQASSATSAPVQQTHQSTEFARLHLRTNVLDPVSLHQLAIALDPANPARGRGLQLAERVTRRHAPTEIQRLVEASGEQDYAALVRHADHLLALPTGIEESLLKSLAQGVSDPALRDALHPYRQRRWFGRLMTISLDNANLQDVLALLNEPSQSDPVTEQFLTALQERLVTAGMWQEARGLAIARGGVAPEAIDSFALPGAVSSPAGRPMTWRIADDSVDLSIDKRNSGMAFAIAGGTMVPIMERFTAMPPGDYELVHAMAHLDARGLNTWWDVTCKGAHGAQGASRQRIAVSEREERYRVSIPDGCSYQHWELHALGEDGQRPILFELKQLDLRALHIGSRVQ